MRSNAWLIYLEPSTEVGSFLGRQNRIAQLVVEIPVAKALPNFQQ
jgi:hypothetical protein